jgi:Protein ChrB, N-terminal
MPRTRPDPPPAPESEAEPARAAGVPQRWLVLVYRVPSEPTRLRATVWRRLRSLGAVYLQNSVAALPAGPSGERAMRKLRHEITEMGGTAVLLASEALVGETEVMSIFQAARDDEYEEIVDRCQDFLAQVEKEHVAQHFSFAELEENEVDLVKLQNWFEKVRARDAFGAPGGTAAEQALARCEVSLEGYASRVFEEETEAH